MSMTNRWDATALAGLGEEMYRWAERLYPLCRSITGAGVEDTLAVLREQVPLHIERVPSGTKVFDWKVPREWNIRDAYVKDPTGRRVIDFHANNLHVVSYSRPVHKQVSLAELKAHTFTIPEQPDWIPYRTSYYAENWGFCAAHNVVNALPDGMYEVCVDASLQDGHLAYGEYLHHGYSEEEVLFSTHTCHPSLCNDNLSGIALNAMLASLISQVQTRYSYRFLFIPGTIGSITWLSRNQQRAQSIKHGLVVTCVGDGGPFRYKRSRRGDAEIDRAVEYVLRHTGGAYQISDFSPYGYDERQYCSPGFNLAVGSLTRSSHRQYPQYHTSADDLGFVGPNWLEESLSVYLKVISVLETNQFYVNKFPFCEPQLGRRGLYDDVGAHPDPNAFRMALLWVLNQSDGEHALLDIAEKSQIPIDTVAEAASALHHSGLLEMAAARP